MKWVKNYEKMRLSRFFPFSLPHLSIHVLHSIGHESLNQMPAAKWGKITKKMIVGNIWQCDRLITNLKKIELSYVSQKAAIWLKQFVRMILEWIRIVCQALQWNCSAWIHSFSFDWFDWVESSVQCVCVCAPKRKYTLIDFVTTSCTWVLYEMKNEICMISSISIFRQCFHFYLFAENIYEFECCML